MTRRQAIEKCRDMWDILAENGGKREAKKQAYIDAGGKRCYMTACFFCYYHCTHKRIYCDDKCIGAEIWRGASCCSPNSPWKKWRLAETPRTRKKYAKQIADGCRKLLKG